MELSHHHSASCELTSANLAVRSFIPQPAATPTAVLGGNQAQALIAVGLIVLIAVVIWPAIPAVTAMALVTLGATRVMLQRLRSEPAALPLVLLHLSVYGGLYAIFVTASLHATFFKVGTPHILTAIDLAVSTLPITLAMRQILGALQDDSLTA